MVKIVRQYEFVNEIKRKRMRPLPKYRKENDESIKQNKIKIV